MGPVENQEINFNATSQRATLKHDQSKTRRVAKAGFSFSATDRD